MTQPKRKKNEGDELVKLIHEMVPGQLVKMLEFGIDRIIDAELSDRLGVEPYERSKARDNYRNSYRQRKQPLSTAIGPVSVKIPKLRKGSFYPSVLEQYQRVDRATISIITEAYFNGVSTRKMDNLFSDMGLGNIDRSLVSRCASQIDEEVQIWRNRRLNQRYAYVWVDAIYTKVRTERGVVSTAVLIAIALKEDGHRDVLGMELGNSESYHNWKGFFQSLKARGLERGELWISDEHDGLVKALHECFPGQLRQRCIVHWMRNAISKVSKTDLRWFLPLLKNLVNSSTKSMFDVAWGDLSRELAAKGREELLDWLDSTYHDIVIYLDFPPSHWSKIKSTNPIERLNQELRRREKCIRIFPDEKSCIRLMGAILQGYSDDWTTGRIYLRDPIEAIKENQVSQRTGSALARDGLQPCSAGSTGLQPVAKR
ncbi:MAG: IS256 family transposase [Candidatus Cloacimonetes bacterium]|jgi:transposase-like protein|nr:IS256 family transposase [Candidatus Cloacimonadota bacterium]